MHKLIYITAAVILWNILIFALYGCDKYRARKKRRRIRENTLIACAFLMGGVGAWLGMCAFRHKTKHRRFRMLIPLAMAVTICAVFFGAYWLAGQTEPVKDDVLQTYASDEASIYTSTPSPADASTPTKTLSSTNIPTPTKEPAPEPTEAPEPFVYNGLVDLADYDAGFIFDLTYATENNFLGVVLYETALCLAHTDLAEVLLAAQAKLAEQGLRLIIYDVYRPMSVQQTMYDLTPEAQRKYVAKPGPKANHTKGVAVDCALADANGVPLPMPSGYDDLSNRASIDYTGGTAEETANRDFLIALMTELGLKVAKGEWWHYALSDAAAYEGLDIGFDAYLAARP